MAGYWKAVPNDPDDIMDGLDFEIVYVYFDGKFSVRRIGDSKHYRYEDFHNWEPLDP